MRHPAHATSELIDVVYLVTQAFWAELRRSGETIEMSQWSTLRRIGRTPCTMSELARYKGVGLPTISKSVDMLVRRGWAERWIDKSDRRQTLVRLTPSGKKMHDIYFLAWQLGQNTTYYLRSLGATAAEKSTGQRGELNAETTQKPHAGQEPKQCLIDDPNC